MNPLAVENHLKLVLFEWMIIIAMAWLCGRLAKKAGQPLAVGEIVGGLVLGPSALGLIWPHDWPLLFPSETQQSLQLLGRIGIILFLFQVGMEFDFAHVRTRSKTVIGVSLMGILVPFIGGYFASPWLHRNFAPQVDFLSFQLFVGVALSITALPVMGRILLEMGLERSIIGSLAISAAAVDDVLGWCGLAIVTALATSGFAWLPVVRELVGVAVFFLVLNKGVGPLIKWYWRKSIARSPEGGMPPPFLAVFLLVLFACCLVANGLGVFSIFGAFLFGVSLHDQRDLVKAWRDQFANFVLVALVPIFFTNTGLRTDIGSLSTGMAWVGCAVVVLVGTLGKLLGCYFPGRWTGQSHRESLSIAALMNTRGLMGLIAINVGYDLKVLPKELFTMFVVMNLATTAMTRPLLVRWLPREAPEERPVYRKNPQQDKAP